MLTLGKRETITMYLTFLKYKGISNFLPTDFTTNSSEDAQRQSLLKNNSPE